MRVFGIEASGTFQEYVQTPFQVDHEEKVLEQWLEANPDGILEDSKLLAIGRQVATNLGGYIDLLAIDRQGNVVVLELKRDRTPRDTLAQALEYASFAKQLDTDQLQALARAYMNEESLSLAQYHREYFGLGLDEAVAFNKDQRIAIVGQRISQEIRQTAQYLCERGLGVTCVEFTFHQSSKGDKMLSQEAVVSDSVIRPAAPQTSSLPRVTCEKFLASVDVNGKPLFARLLRFAEERAMPIHWGSKGFSVNVNLNGTHVAVCGGYPPACVYKQVITTWLRGQGGMASKTAVPPQAFEAIWGRARATGLFEPWREDLRCVINRNFSEQEIQAVLSVVQDIANAVQEYGLRQ